MLKKMTVDEKLNMLTGDGPMSAVSLPMNNFKSIVMGDGPNGIKTADGATMCFMNTCLMACSWDEDVCYEMGRMLSSEVARHGVDLLLAPAINIKRNPLCGRNFEYYSEDPLLTGRLASAFIRGLKSNGLCVCAKHFAANSQETDRWLQDSVVDDDTLRNIYLRAFELVVKNTDVDCIMAAYNRVNGEYACQNGYLLNDVLRKEWGFNGVVMSDWCAAVDIVSSLNSGLDLEMPGNAHNTVPKLRAAVHSGELSVERVNASAARLVELALKVENYRENKNKGAEVGLDTDALVKHTGESMVLLKNGGALPLAKNKKLLLVGNANAPRIQGGGCAELKTQTVLTPMDELSGYATCHLIEDYQKAAEANVEDYDGVIVFLYLDKDCDSESFDRRNMSFPAEQISAVNHLAERSGQVIAVLQNGSAVELPFKDSVNAVLECYYFGSYGARSLAGVLFGEITPSGRLAESFPVSYKDVPNGAEYGKGERVVYKEGELVGYRHYTAFGLGTAYPFGHGLSYCDFTWNSPIIAEKGDFCYDISLTVENKSSTFSGKETVQVYLKSASLKKPAMQLIAFSRVALAPGEAKRVEISVGEAELSRYTAGKRVLLQGNYFICIARSSEDVVYERKVSLGLVAPCRIDGQTPMRALLTDGRYREIALGYMQGVINVWAYGRADADGCFEDDVFLRESVYAMPIRAFTYFDKNLFDETDMQSLLGDLNR